MKRQDNHPSIDIAAIYNYSPYIPIVLDVQKGTLSGGGLTPAQDKFGRRYINQYYPAYLYADFQLGEVIDYSVNDFRNK